MNNGAVDARPTTGRSRQGSDLQYFKLRPGTEYGTVDLEGCIGDGERWEGAWVGVVYIEVPYDESLFVPADWPITQPRGVAERVVVADRLPVLLKDCPQCPGGWRERAQDKVTLLWRCALQHDQIEPAL